MTQQRGTDWQTWLPDLLQVAGACGLCPQTKPGKPKFAVAGSQKGSYPGEEWQLAFILMPKVRNAQYLLVWVDTFTSWVEAFPCRTEKAREVTQVLLRNYPEIWISKKP